MKNKIDGLQRRTGGNLAKVVERRRQAQICVFFGLSTYFFGEALFNRETNLVFDQRDDPQFLSLKKKDVLIFIVYF